MAKLSHHGRVRNAGLMNLRLRSVWDDGRWKEMNP